MKIEIDLEQLKNDNDGWSETTAKAVEHLTGKSFPKAISDAKEKAKESAKPHIPDGKPSQWRVKTKNKFISEHGIDEFKRVVIERERG